MEKANYKFHISALLFLFTTGNAIIGLPFYNSENFLSVLLLTVVFSVLFTAFLFFVLKKAQHFSNRRFRKILYLVGSAIILLSAVYGGFTAICDYVRFVKKIQLPETNVAVIAVVFLAVSLSFFKIKPDAVLKFCLILAVTTAFLIILLSVVSVKNYEFQKDIFKIGFSKNVFSVSVKCFFKYYASLAAAIAFVFLIDKPHRKNAFCGVASGFFAILVITLQTVMILGKNANYDFAYFYAVSVYSSGSLFSRLDGLVYFIFFVSALTKTAVCVKTILLLYDKFKNNKLSV